MGSYNTLYMGKPVSFVFFFRRCVFLSQEGGREEGVGVTIYISFLVAASPAYVFIMSSSASDDSSSDERSPIKQLGHVTCGGMFEMLNAVYKYGSTFSHFSREGLCFIVISE